MSGRGVDTIPLRIPERWDPAWFSSFVREVLKYADTRNAIEGPGIKITGTPDVPATVSASDDLQNLLLQSFILATPSGFLDFERVLDGEAGVVDITDNGPNSTIEVGLRNLGVPLGKLEPIPAFSVLGNQLTSAAGVSFMTAANEGDVLWLRDVDGAGTLGLEFSYLRFLDGTAGAPGIAWYDDQENGLFRIGEDNFGMSTDGTLRWDIDTARTLQNIPLRVAVPVTVAGTFYEAQTLYSSSTKGGLQVLFQDGTPLGDDMEVTLGMWSTGTAPNFPPFASAYGFRFDMIGHGSASPADFIFRAHNASSSGTEIYSAVSDRAQLLFIAGSATVPPVAFSDNDSGFFWTGATTRIGVTVNGTGLYSFGADAIRSVNPIYGSAASAAAPMYSYSQDVASGWYQAAVNQVNAATSGVLRLTIGTTQIISTLPIRGPDGSASAPTYSYSSDSGNGDYLSATDTVSTATNGVLRYSISTTLVTSTLPFGAPDGAVGTPGQTFSGDLNTGRYRIGTDNMGDTAGGVLQLEFGTTYVDLKTQARFTGVISPAQLTANTDDWNPTNLATASTIRVSTDASRNLTGIQGGVNGRILILRNVGTQPLVLVHDATSTAANRFFLASAANKTIQQKGCAVLQYDGTDSRWYCLTVLA